MKNGNLNVPNILCIIRILCVPLTIVLIAYDHMIWSLVSFLFACLTDMVDGHIARKYNIITKLGIWLDPLADKLMALGVIITFSICNIIPYWVLIVLLSKELIMIIGGWLIMRNGFSTPSNKFGKAAAFIMNTSIAACFLYKIEWWNPYYRYFVYFGLAFSVFSMIQYAIKNGHLLFEKKSDNIA